MLGQNTSHSKGCRIIRITEEIGAATIEGAYLAAKGCSSNNAMIFAAIPCTGGSPFQHLNKHKPDGMRKIREHIKEMLPLLRIFESLCHIAKDSNCKICMEWPTGCTYWSRDDVKSVIKRFDLIKVNFHGCALGLTGIEGGPLFKPWTFATDCPEIINIFQHVRCSRTHEHESVAGRNTKSTENYTIDFAAKIHDAFRTSTIRKSSDTVGSN